jgi:hypothetical protein
LSANKHAGSDPKKPLEERVSEWLEKHGGPLELRMGHAIRQAGWDVEHGALFTDPITQKVRELDIVASQRFSPDDRRRVGFSLAIECKTAKDKPWVIFSAPTRTEDQIRGQVLAPGRLASRMLVEFLRTNQEPPKLLRLGGRRGYAVTVALTDVNESYPALAGIVSAVVALNADALAIAQQGMLLQAFFPVLVVDGLLFDYFLNPVGVPILAPIVWAKVIAPPIRTGGVMTIVNIVTPQALPNLLQDAYVDATEFLRLGSANFDTIVEGMRKPPPVAHPY